MSQNLISFQMSATDLAAVDGALKTLEDKLTGLIDLTIEQRRFLTKMAANPKRLPARRWRCSAPTRTCCPPTSTLQSYAAI
ncbi:MULTISPECIES: hypothetical protein [Ralstonia]|uniref:hypothetical protein n=1 Tax=Ralstonia TaxID=48736 RepID=UPI0021558FBF|nr:MULTISPECIES: hypothetical protein [Ralstonia]